MRGLRWFGTSEVLVQHEIGSADVSTAPEGLVVSSPLPAGTPAAGSVHAPTVRRRWRGLVKRALDLGAALVLLLLLAPLLLSVSLIIVAGSPGPVLYVHPRVGRDGREFRLYKLRTMVRDADDHLAAHLAEHTDEAREWARFHKLRSDPRITRVGRILRRCSLDELPQLINVVKGDMSLVGPRPVTAAELDLFGDALGDVLSVRPGLTGLWAVSGRSNLSYGERVRLEHRYATTWTFGLDVTILLKTVGAVFRGEGAY